MGQQQGTIDIDLSDAVSILSDLSIVQITCAGQ